MEVSELLFVEYTCMQEENKFGVWSNNNYFAFISSGKKVWRTIHHSYDAIEGDILFIKKDGSKEYIDLNKYTEIYGLFLFDGKKTPKLVDMMNIDTELYVYFKK